MRKIIDFIIKKRLFFCLLFAALTVAAAVCIPMTELNYDDTVYLPAGSETKAGLRLMETQFGENGSAEALLKNADMEEILRLQSRMQETRGVSDVIWLDDILLPLAGETELDDVQAMELLLRALDTFPATAQTTPEELAASLWAEFDETERDAVMPMLESVTDAAGGGDFDIGRLSELEEPVSAEYLAGVATLRERLTSLAMLAQDPAAMAAMAGMGAAMPDEATIALLTRLAELLPDAKETKNVELARILYDEFGEDGLPAVLDTLQGLGGNAVEMSAEEIAMVFQPLGADYADAIAALHEQIDSFYKDGNALFTVAFARGDYASATVSALRELTGLSEDLILSGNAASSYYMRENQMDEIVQASVMVVIVALVILFVLSSSWLDPLLYILAIVTAIVLNMGSNVFLGRISYLTESVACILQLALSIDYAVFLINRYKEERARGLEAEGAMAEALRRAFAAISASSLTTIACFVTIMFMQYTLGLDMGVVMAKGIVFSMLTVFLLLPGVIVYCDKWLSRAGHRSFAFRCQKLGRFSYRCRWLLAVLAAALIIPAAFISGENSFVYGSVAMQGADGKGMLNRQEIEEVFGSREQLAILVPRDEAKESALAAALKELDGVATVSAWATVEENGLEPVLPDAMRDKLVGESYDRFVLTLDCEEEGAATEALLENIRAEVEALYSEGDGATYLLGNTVAAVDIRESTSSDYLRIALLSIAAVALIVALTFRSLLLPLVLVAVIEGAVWINMAIPALLGNPMVYLGYMIISNVLLGSTIDYAILLTSNYAEARHTLAPAEAVGEAQRRSVRSILTSGVIFSVGGALLGLMTSIPAVELLGFAIMRGGLCAMVLTIFALPALLAILDKLIRAFHRA